MSSMTPEEFEATTFLEFITDSSTQSVELPPQIIEVSLGVPGPPGGGAGSTDPAVTAHLSNTSNPHSVTKAQVGLASVENIAPNDLPVSTAQAQAIALREPALPIGTSAQYFAGDKTLATFPTLIGQTEVETATGTTSRLINALRIKQGIDFHTKLFAVDVATTADIARNGLETVDDVVTTDGMVVLVKDQTTGSQNGIFKVVAGSAWTRHTAYNDGPKLSGASVRVLRGTVNGGKKFTTSFKATQTVATDTNTWLEFGAGGGAVVVPPNSVNPTADTLVMRTNDGRAKGSDPSEVDDFATRGWTTTQIAAIEVPTTSVTMSNLPEGMVFARYCINGVWQTRGTTRTDLTCDWISTAVTDADAPIGGTGALGKDRFFKVDA